MVGVFERVYETGPVFRAEPHDTVRHLAEYVSLDVELGFIDDHRDVMRVLRDVVAGMVAGDPGDGAADALRCRSARCRWCRRRFPVIHFADALPRRARPGRADLARSTSGRWALGAARARQRLPGGRGLPVAQTAVLHPPAAGDPRWTNSLRPALPRPGAGHRRPAPAPVRATTSTRWPPAARRSSRTRRTWRPSGTGCRRTAGSRSGWSGGSRGWWAPRTSARRHCSRAICTGSRPEPGAAGRWAVCAAHRHGV